MLPAFPKQTLVNWHSQLFKRVALLIFYYSIQINEETVLLSEERIKKRMEKNVQTILFS